MKTAQSMHGITLLDALIAILVISLGVFGILGIQLRTLADTQAGIHRAQAIYLIGDLSERIRSNPEALVQHAIYIQPPDGRDAGRCSTTCSPAEKAARDMAEWHLSVQAILGHGQAVVFELSHSKSTLGVLIAWRENEHSGVNAAKTVELDALIRNASNTAIGTYCPNGYMCHLQSIHFPVADYSRID